MTRLCPAALAFLCLFAGLLSAQTPDPAQAVRAAVANEVQATEHRADSFMYRLAKESKSGTQVKDMIETKSGIVARLISLNGRPLTDAERAADDQRLESLIHDPSQQPRKLADQQKEQARFLSLLRALPDALLYTYDGTEQIDGRETFRFKFRPNPSFHTTTKETIIFRASEGNIWIDTLDYRIAKFDGTQINDINIGWGLLGHIEKGSKLQVEQRRLGQGTWRLSKLLLEAKGQVLFFKSVTLKQKQMATDFRRVPADLTIAAAVELLKKQNSAIASAP
jgi:hypothetical protein